MFSPQSPDHPQLIHFLILPDFSLFGLTSMLAPLRHANQIAGKPLYQWQLISTHGGDVDTSDGIAIRSDLSLNDVDTAQCVIVCSGDNPERLADPSVLAFLRRQAAFGAHLGAQDTGAYILAAAGVLEGYRTTLHWQNLSSTIPLFPNVTFTQDLYVIDRTRFACSGAMAGLDMMLHLIKAQLGHELATQVGEALIYSNLREHHQPQRASLRKRLNSRNKHLIDAVQLMEGNIEEPLTIPDVAHYIGISERELERLFRQYLEVSPLSYYRQLRLNKARRLLQQSSDSVTKIAALCGFRSLSHFSRSYQQYFMKKPSEER